MKKFNVKAYNHDASKRVVVDHNSAERIKVVAEWNKLGAMGEAGLSLIAANLTNPFRITLDYTNMMRQVFMLQKNYPAGQPFLYETDLVRTVGIITRKGGAAYQFQQSPNRVYMDEEQITSQNYVPISDMYTRTYDVSARAKDRCQEGVGIREDLILLALLSAAANSTFGHPVVATGGMLDKASIAKAKKLIKNQSQLADKIITNPGGMSGIERLTFQDMDQKGMQETRETGTVSVFMGMSFLESFLVAAGRSYVTTTPDLVGALMLRTDAIIDVFPEYQTNRIGVRGYELYAAICHNAKGVVELQFNPNA